MSKSSKQAIKSQRKLNEQIFKASNQKSWYEFEIDHCVIVKLNL